MRNEAGRNQANPRPYSSAAERSDGSVGANAAVLEAQSAKTTLFFMSESRKTARALSAEAKERIWPLYAKALSKNFVIFSVRLIAWYRTEEPQL